MMSRIRTQLQIVVAVLLIAAGSVQAAVMVRGTVTPIAGAFRYTFEVENTGPGDFVLVSLVDAPLADPLIAPTMTTPAGFLGSYDGVLGIVDFIEGTMLFAAGTTRSGFRFDSLAGPGTAFTLFEALDTQGGMVTGTVQFVAAPPPAPMPMITTGLSAGSGTVAGKSTPCGPGEDEQVVIYDCGTNPADCAGCAPGFPPMPCPNPVIGMGMKNATGGFVIPVTALMQGHHIYASDACTESPFNVGAPQLVGAAAVAPALSLGMLALLVGLLVAAGFHYLRRTPNAGMRRDVN